MTTIVNTPPTSSADDSGGRFNAILIAVFGVVFLVLFVYLLLPVMRRATEVPQINIPDKVDINVNTTPQQ